MGFHREQCWWDMFHARRIAPAQVGAVSKAQDGAEWVDFRSKSEIDRPEEQVVIGQKYEIPCFDTSQLPDQSLAEPCLLSQKCDPSRGIAESCGDFPVSLLVPLVAGLVEDSDGRGIQYKFEICLKQRIELHRAVTAHDYA